MAIGLRAMVLCHIPPGTRTEWQFKDVLHLHHDEIASLNSKSTAGTSPLNFNPSEWFSSVAIAAFALAAGVIAGSYEAPTPLSGFRLQSGSWERAEGGLPRTLNFIVSDDAGTNGASTFGNPVVLGAFLSTQLVCATSNPTFLDVQCIFTARALEPDHQGFPVSDLRRDEQHCRGHCELEPKSCHLCGV
ncbi:hypothetical protein PV04_05314 [Phialophora macrospora]|uniref:Uncharacterized protein n=1 Tax=Phialophora macrospora TaxID=1851006 RepID=A0A0D2E527_9EURO|nr:hypothetical protein PV04_05314 [Phialophora macrospora]